MTNDASELASTTRLLLVRKAEFSLLGDGLTERNARLASGALGVVLTTHTLNIDFKMELSHSGDDRLCPPVSDVELDQKGMAQTSLLSWSMWTRNVGSSFWNRLSAREKLGVSWPLGLMASEMTGSGTNILVYR